MKQLFLMLATAAVVHAADCEALKNLTLKAVTITAAEAVPAGPFTPPDKSKIGNMPPFCRVAATSKPSADSDIQFEVWMPAEGWNGKFQGVGNGGYAGSISYGAMATAVRAGYATASTDTGHKAAGGGAGWALGHPEKTADFGHRAIHEMTVHGKALLAAYYGSPAKRAYFSSCSNGGRQALMEAQRYPADYDGIVAGAPANYWTRLMVNGVNLSRETAASESGYIPAAKLPAIQAAALAACDAGDGARDGVIGDPERCRLDLSRLQCKGAENDECLTPGQVKELQVLYGGTKTSKGKVVSPGYTMGGEAESGGWGPWITGAAREKSLMFMFGTEFFKNMVYSDKAWDYRKFDVDRDWKAAEAKAGPLVNADNPNLKAFHARGGKLILYHGWSDAAIPGQMAITYFESVQKKMGAKKTSEFVRLFMVPGMQHCGAGSGANSFGQGGTGKGDPKNNVAAALEHWVEQGVAPEEIIAMRTAGGKVEKTRPLCAHPKVAKYKGAGDVNDAANWACTAPGK
ncbi:MAG: tannase/feruloyl esterase family alpha/beta hydrolase [Acidobacteria bacterium]|nr:tannase/feruloyl esterase family alpha/beta hydrolase [Acidobacteriota bacterium]